MPSFSGLFTFALLAIAANAATVTTIVPPALRGAKSSNNGVLNLNNAAKTDFNNIASTVGSLRKTVAASDATPKPTFPSPDGYELVFGPVNGANNAPGYMGFTFLDKYDVNACAAQCNARGSDPNGGACQFFNIWRAVVNGVPTTYTCSFYYIPADASTAVNYGQGDLKVTHSRGYRRKSLVIDGGFEGYTCDEFCFDEKYANWIGTSPAGGTLDATIFHFQPYAHSGGSVALLGSATGVDTKAGLLSPAQPLVTVPGKKYVITFFHSSDYSDEESEKDAFVDVMWNNAVVSTIRPAFSSWKYFEFTVTARGKDKLAFHGGKAPAWSFIDDVNVFAL